MATGNVTCLGWGHQHCTVGMGALGMSPGMSLVHPGDISTELQGCRHRECPLECPLPVLGTSAYPECVNSVQRPGVAPVEPAGQSPWLSPKEEPPGPH